MFVASAVVISASFAYAARVGEQTATDDAARRRQRLATPSTFLGGDEMGPGGSGGMPGGPTPRDGPGITMVPGAPPTGNSTFNGLDMAAAAPPEQCLGDLPALAATDPFPAEQVEEAWQDAADCAMTRGAIIIPDLSAMTDDVLVRQCLGAYFISATLAYRAPDAPTAGLDRFLQSCVDAGLAPGRPMPASPSPGRGPRPTETTPAVAPDTNREPPG